MFTICVLVLPVLLFSKSYCIYIDKVNLTPNNNIKIHTILDDIAYPSTKIVSNQIFIYSGRFRSYKDASRLVPLTKSRYKNAKVASCDDTARYLPTQNLYNQDNKKVKKTPKKEFVFTPQQTTIYTNDFSVEMLDENGYISREIMSKRFSRRDEKLKSEDARDALNRQENGSFNGLYLKTNTAYDILNDDTAYDIRLEFDIFDQGYYANKRKNEKYKLSNQISFYKTIKNIEVLKHEQELLKIKKYQNSVSVSSLLLKLRVSESNLKKAKQKFKEGVLTQYDYDGYKLIIQKLKDELFMFKNMTLLKIPQNLWTLLNEIEYTKTIDEDKLLEILDKENIDLKLAQTLQNTKLLTEQWSDKLKVNVYAGTRKMYLAQKQTLIGVEAKIPLSTPSRRVELDRLQNTMLVTQAKLQHSKSKETLKDAIAAYKYRQQKIKTYSYELSRIKKRLKDLKTIDNSLVSSYITKSFDNEQKLLASYLTKHTQIEQERLLAYKELVGIMYLIHSNSLKDVLHYGVYR